MRVFHMLTMGTQVCLVNEWTIVVAWRYQWSHPLDFHVLNTMWISNEEVAIYLQTYKAYENKSPDSIKERVDKDYPSLLRAALTSIKGVNKTDVTTLRTHFGVHFLWYMHLLPALNRFLHSHLQTWRRRHRMSSPIVLG
jgi:hypothetical protein